MGSTDTCRQVAIRTSECSDGAIAAMHLSGRDDAPRVVPQPTITRTPIPVFRGNIRNGSGDRDRLSRRYGRQRETYSQHEARAHAHEASAGAAREIFSARRAPNEG